ncbi:MAG: sensor histidine kinase [Prevotella sp.]|jgi:signal transduction histidine kinase
MKKISVGERLYLNVMAIFLLFAAAFIIYQHNREKRYKINLLETRLQDFNIRMNDALHYEGKADEITLAAYVKAHAINHMRVTVISPKGNVIFDNIRKDYSNIGNHANRQEIKDALKSGSGSTIERKSKTIYQDYFYSATYFKQDGYIIRSALPYNDNLTRTLQTDQHYIWFALIACIILTIVLYRFVLRLGKNITNLKIFAYRADHNESLNVDDLGAFPDDELGEIAERIIKIYKQLESTRKEQGVLKRQLTQNIAHELKTPVASIQGYLETILDNPHIDEKTKHQFLLRSYAQSERLTSLLRDISTLNRMDDAPQMTDFEDVAISDLVLNIQKETALQLEERQMVFHNLLPGGIHVKGNHSLLYSVFRNLTDNAISYAGVGTAITLQAEETSDSWEFTFQDNGCGVSPEHLPRIFERFYRVDKGRSRKMGGTGLGLAIVKNAVLLHGGHIHVNNVPTGGLMFRFSIRKQ